MKTVWLARDKDGWLEIYYEKPKQENGVFFQIQGRIGLLPKSWFPEITNENSPIECKLTLNILKDYK